MQKHFVSDITGRIITITDLDAVISKCDKCKNNPLVIMGTRFTEGQNNRFLLPKLWKIKQEINKHKHQ